MINSNSYFEGNVLSLGYTTAAGKSTVGVMEPGSYEFGTGSAEVMTVIEGEMEVVLPGETESKMFGKGEFYEVPANSKFQVTVNVQTSYLCQYS